MIATVSIATAVTQAAETKFEAYTQQIPGTTVSFEMVPIPGGTIKVGTPANAANRDEKDLPQQEVTIKPFWMGKHEVAWQEYINYVFGDREEIEKEKADGVTRPTKPYGSVYRERGEKGYPAIGMSQLSATEYCKWLSRKTGVKYRLPTEAEWEYACRAGATTPYFWGDDPSKAGEYAWYTENSKETTQPIGKKAPNKFGLHDIAGNVAEWVAKDDTNAPGVLRGGAFSEPVTSLRCAARMIETEEWNELDPQSPPSIWWLSAADFAGFRLVRSAEEDSQTSAKPAAQAAAKPAAQAAAKTAAVGDLAKTKALYKKYCAGCHGQTGKGDTKLGKKYKARDYTSPEVKKTLKDEAMFKAIKEGLTVDGHEVMKPYADKMTDAEIRDVVQLMKDF